MIPIRDHQPTGIFPFINYLLLVANIVVFIYMLSLGPASLDKFIYSYALIPANLLSGSGISSLVTSMFLHAGFAHIIGNMLFLHIFGDNLEEHFGHLGYLIFYLLSGLGAAALQIVIDPASTIPMLGASGAIAGLMGGYLLLFPRNRIDVLIPFGLLLHRATLPAITMLGYWIVYQILLGLGTLGATGGGVAYFAHIGGFITGVLLTKLKR